MTPSVNIDQLQDAIEQRFECVRCGHCCKGDGIVQFGTAEARAMAGHLGLTVRRFTKEYAIRIEDGQWMLRDRMVPAEQPGRPDEQWCIFLEREPDGRYACRVDQNKPEQCRTFPAQWRNPDTLTTCPGMRHLLAALRREKN